MKAVKFLIFPVILALLLPQLLFAAKDRIQMEKTYVGKREGIDPTLLNIEYVQGSDYRKLSWLAHCKKERHEMRLLESEGELSQAQQKEYLNRIVYDERFAAWGQEVGQIIYLSYRLFYEQKGKYSYYLQDIQQEWKKYLLLDEQKLEALELWYGTLIISKEPEVRVHVWLDAEDGLVYYVRFGLINLPKEAVEWRKQMANPTATAQDILENTFLDGQAMKDVTDYPVFRLEDADLEGLEYDPYDAVRLLLEYYPKDSRSNTVIDQSRLTADFNYQEWTGDLEGTLQFELFFDSVAEDYFMRVGICEFGELLPETE